MPRAYRTLVPFLLLALTGCITIEEHYTFKKNGSGSMEYVVDMSELGDMMKAFEEIDKNGTSEKSEGMGELDLSDELVALKKIPGIKKVKVNDKKKFVQRLSFSFADTEALNAALNVLMPDSSGKQFTFFQWEGKTLVRTNNRHANELGSGMGQGDDDGDTTDMTAFLESMKYKYSFRFAEPVVSTTEAEGMVKESPDPRTVRFATDWSVITKDEKALDLRIDMTP